jgi:hypothetical protein
MSAPRSLAKRAPRIAPQPLLDETLKTVFPIDMSAAKCILLTTAAGIAAIAPAQENIFRALPGSKQIGIMGSFVSGNGTSTYSATLEGGYYLSEKLVAIGRLGVIKRSPENWMYLVGARYEFDPKGTTTPYLVASVEFHNGRRGANSGGNQLIFTDPNDPNATYIQGGAGINHFLNASTAAFLEVVAFKKSGDNRIGTNVEIGLRIFFK